MATTTRESEISITSVPMTAQDLLDQLGGIEPGRVRMKPLPGLATEAELIEVNARKQGICELVDGTLVEKAMGKLESLLAGAIIAFLRDFIIPRRLGIVTAPDGMMRLAPGLFRAPDVTFIAWNRIPKGPLSEKLLAEVIPDLAVEVLRPSNTKAEMARKRAEYFAAGVRLVWQIDPRTRTIAVFSTPEQSTIPNASMTLDGGDVLPGFALPPADLFAELDRHGG